MLENRQKLSSNQKADDVSIVTSAPSINLPRGGGAIRGIDEKFQINPDTGTASLSIPIFTSPGRQSFSPRISLNYDSGSGNGPFGLGWSLSVPSITRKTDKGVPKYQDSIGSDIFILSGAEDLVPALKREGALWTKEAFERTVDGEDYTVQRYRPRIEGLYARIERWRNKSTGHVHWESITKDNVKSTYGKGTNSRISDPEDPGRVFKWLLEQSHDDKGNVIIYEYKQENAEGVDPSLPQEKNRLANDRSYSNVYLKRIKYANETPYYPIDNPSVAENWFFEVVFDYGEHDEENPTPTDDTENTWDLRQDSFSSFKSGFEIRTQRLCKRVLMFHYIPEREAMPDVPYLVRSTDFDYQENPVLTKLVSATQTGYVRNDSGSYTRKSLPPLEFGYIEPEIDRTVKYVDHESLEDLPGGLNGGRYQWVDLDGEGISGILKEEGEGWFYKHNLGGFKFDVQDLIDDQFPPDPPSAKFVKSDSDTENLEGRFTRAKLVAHIPSLSNLENTRQQVMDLAGDGRQDLVLLSKPVAGYYERGDENTWENLIPFRSNPGVSWNSPDLRFVDLDGDGHTDIFITQNDLFIWHPSLAKEGFGSAKTVFKMDDEEKGPTLIFSDATQSIYLADITGGGLTDLVRIRNGEVCYWPSMGYGRFGAKVTMGNSPYFDHPDYFNQNRIRLADIDGSGTTDIFYLGRDEIAIWFNQAGNCWSEPEKITTFPKVDNLSSVTVVDLLGNGTACLVWLSPLPGDAGRPMRYIDLMGGEKPHLLTSIKNNMGAETKLDYAPSTKFYLEDKAKGRPWITRLPFPVHVLERVEVIDHISKSKFVSLYKYHHGYFDGEEREFRGFGLVEQWDTEHFNQFNGDVVFANAADEELHQPPVYAKTWFHTGTYINGEKISQQYGHEYYKGDALAQLLPDTQIPAGLTAEEEREAARALKGRMLRQEIYSVDGSDKSEHPYTASETTYKLKFIQPRFDDKFAVFYCYQCEALSYHYERDPDDPRIDHAMTLEVDDFGDVTKSATIGYPRRVPEFPEQGGTLITYSEARLTNKPDEENWYRIGVPIESKTYELTDVALPNDSKFYTPDSLLSAGVNAEEIPYEAIPTGAVQKRLIEHSRTIYLNNDLNQPLPLNELESLALPHKSYTLAFTPALLEQIYGEKFSTVQERDGLLREEGRYLSGGDLKEEGLFPDEDPDDLWWVQTGRPLFSPHPHQPDVQFAKDKFFLVQGSEDPFGNISTVTYDDHRLLVVETIDPVGNTITADNNYRTLQPELMTDINGNRSAVAFDALGMVVGTAVMGKSTEILGDSLDGFQADLEETVIDRHIGNPLDNPHDILQEATTRLVYDLNRFQNDGKPNVIYTLARETHESDLDEGEQTKIQHSLVYSDGYGREIMRKIQAEPGIVPLRDEDGILIRDEHGEIVRGHVDNRWVGNGRTVFNNKGNPVKQYEPFFDSFHDYNEEVEMVERGVTPIIHYDSLSRVIRTDLPNGTFSRVEFNPWRQITWDHNDTVLESDWFNDLLPDFDPDNLPNSLTSDQISAVKASRHANTPLVQHLDILGRAFLSVEDNSSQKKYETHVTLDIESDALVTTDARGNEVETKRYDVLGRILSINRMDSGERVLLSSVAGNPVRIWDSKGQIFRFRYDDLQRLSHTFAKTDDGTDVLLERTIFGEVHPNASELNLKGQVYQQYDGAGVVSSEKFDFKGNLLRVRRQLAQEFRQTIDWNVIAEENEIDAIQNLASSLLDATEIFTTSTSFDALNRQISVTTPDDSEILASYNAANLMEDLGVRLRGANHVTRFVSNVDYNSKGQRALIEYGNGITSQYQYDDKTFRLTRLTTTRQSQPRLLQDLVYTYDPAGNCTQIRDDAQQAIFFDNTVVDSSSNYVYDAIYRLIEASGREHIGQNVNVQIDHDDGPRINHPLPSDEGAMRKYKEKYEYDEVGNILSISHQAGGGSWTRRYEYGVSNKLVSTTLPGDGTLSPLPVRYIYDRHGNMIQMPHLLEINWSTEDRMQRIDLQGGGKLFFVYDSSGQRIRKVHEHNGTTVEEKICLGGYEIYRRIRNGELDRERNTLHIMDDQNRIAIVETLTVNNGIKVQNPTNIQRYQLRNHLNSSALEVNELAEIISFEEYHPFGTTSYQSVTSNIEVSKKAYRYIGCEKDEESGLYHLGARYYAPWLGRWTAVDPMGLSDGINVYAYGKNNPIRFSDPSGRDSDIAVHGDPDLAYRARLSEYNRLLQQYNFQNSDFNRNRERYSSEVQQVTKENLAYARSQLKHFYKELRQEYKNLPEERRKFRVSQFFTAERLRKLEDVKQKFRNAEGFVNRFALFVGTSVFGAWVAGGVGGGVILTGTVGGGVEGATFGAGEELIRQRESGKEWDLGKSFEKGLESGLLGAVSGGTLATLGKVGALGFRQLRGGRPSTIGEALEGGLPKPTPPKLGPGEFTNKDVALGVHEDLAFFRGEAKIGIDFPEDPNKSLIENIFAGIDDVVAGGGKIRFNLDRMNLRGAFEPGVALNRNLEDVYGAITSQELRYVIKTYPDKVRFYLDGAEISLQKVKEMAGIL